MTAAAFPPRSVRLTRRRTADLSADGSTGASGHERVWPGGIPSPPRPRVVRDREHPHRCSRGRRGPGVTVPPPGAIRGPQPDRGPRRAHRPAGRHRGSDVPTRAEGGQIEGDPAPLQPVQQTRQLVGAARGHQQSHPLPRQRHRAGAPDPAQHRVPRRDGQLQDVEAEPRQQPDRRCARRGPAEFTGVPLSAVAGFRRRAGAGRGKPCPMNRRTGPRVTHRS